jgi:hypothetical protein
MNRRKAVFYPMRLAFGNPEKLLCFGTGEHGPRSSLPKSSTDFFSSEDLGHSRDTLSI